MSGQINATITQLEDEKITLEDQLNELDRSLAETIKISQDIRKIGEEMARRVQEARERVIAINRMLDKGVARLDRLEEKAHEIPQPATS